MEIFGKVFLSQSLCCSLSWFKKYTIDRFLKKEITFGDRLMNYFSGYFYKNASFIISPSNGCLRKLKKKIIFNIKTNL